MPTHVAITYEDVHKTIKASAEKIRDEFNPDMLIAIGGGLVARHLHGFFPARVLRTFLKNPETKTNIPIYAIGLSLYESMPGTTAEQIGEEVIRTQWLGPETSSALIGRRALIVDEIDDSRKTLQYAITELQKDVERDLQKLPEAEREAVRTKFGVFVVHNKRKEKLGTIPEGVKYFTGSEVDDVWLDYPWESTDIDAHNQAAASAKSSA